MIRIGRNISIDEDELEITSIRSSGPGGQNVNKVSTAVQLRFNASGSPSLSESVRLRLLRLAGRRATAAGVIVIDARRYRSQQLNRQDAIERLVNLIRRAAARPKTRRPTSPTFTSIQRRLSGKRRRSDTKRLRQRPEED